MTQCVNEEFGKLISQYELGCLSDEERDRFEEHLMECDFCLQELEQMRPIMYTLRRNRAEILEALHQEGISFETLKRELLSHSRARQSLVKRLLLAATQALSSLRQAQVLVPAISILFALVLIRAFYWTHHFGPSRTEISEKPHTAPPGGGIYSKGSAPPETVGVFEVLGSIASPSLSAKTLYASILTFDSLTYQPLELRGTAGEADRSFNEGMEYYLKGNYKDTISRLTNAVEKAPENGTWWLYLGVCHYLERDAKAAVKALTRADSLSQFSDKTRARWYLAQAHLLNGDANQAVPLLQWLIDQRKTYAGKADSLLTRVQSIQALKQKEATPK